MQAKTAREKGKVLNFAENAMIKTWLKFSAFYF